MMGLRHTKGSLPTVDGSSWSMLPTRPVSLASSSASISLKIESEIELNESAPLLDSHLRSAIRYYGLKSDQEVKKEKEKGHWERKQRESKFLSLNDYSVSHLERNRSSSSSISPSTEKVKNREVKSNLCTFRLFGVMLILTSALIIATYLLIVESRLPVPSFTLELVHHDIWNKMALPLGDLLNQSRFSGVLVLHTGGTRCDNLVACIKVLNQMQQASNQTELPYNFLIAGDGEAYEIRGWEHKVANMELPDPNTFLVIGFIGNYTKTSPPSILLESALSLIKESVRRKKLLQEYRIYGVRNSTDDGEALFCSIKNWPHFERLFHVN